MNRFFTASELIEAYRLPQHIQDQLFGEVLPVEKDDQGEPLFLESHVDAWLMARYSVPPWRSGCAVVAPDYTAPHTEDIPAFVTVGEAQRRFLGGKKSLRWWYRRIELNMIAHHRVGESILLRTDDIEKFIADSRTGESPPEPAPPIPVGPSTVNRKRRSEPGEIDGRFRFFPR